MLSGYVVLKLHGTTTKPAWPSKRHGGCDCDEGAMKNHVGLM